MITHKSALALVCLACVGHGRRLPVSIEQLHASRSAEREKPRNTTDYVVAGGPKTVKGTISAVTALAALLMGLNPAAMYKLSGGGIFLREGSSAIRSSHLIASHRSSCLKELKLDRDALHLLTTQACAPRAKQRFPERFTHNIVMFDYDSWLPPPGVIVLLLSLGAVLGRPGSSFRVLLQGPPGDDTFALLKSFCRAGGWEVRCKIERQVQRGVVTKLIFGERESSAPSLALPIEFEQSADPELLGGKATLLRPSRFFEPVGDWTFFPESSGAQSQAPFNFRLQCLGLEVGDVNIKSGDIVYFEGQLERDASAERLAKLAGDPNDDGLRIVNGRIRVRFMSSLNALGTVQIRQVGTFTAGPSLRTGSLTES